MDIQLGRSQFVKSFIILAKSLFLGNIVPRDSGVGRIKESFLWKRLEEVVASLRNTLANRHRRSHCMGERISAYRFWIEQ